MAVGTVKYFDPYEGYGYIVPDDAASADDTIFVESDDLDPDSAEQVLRPGVRVTYEQPADGSQAKMVRSV